ncbi:MAG: methyltransferase domain-containing protein [Devosiaceae bacterium]|nr:methyltransferase domain-containing protein [Devosiaceae bacterium MH13]
MNSTPPTAPPVDWDAIDALYDAAQAAEVTGDTATAIAHYRDLLARDPDDHVGASLRLARLTKDQPAKAPDAYVAALFDQVAERFDAILVDELGYAVPLMIADQLKARKAGPFEAWLDLGCGTGLCAMALEDMTTARWGVDLAPTMVEIAGELELYDRLFVGEAVRFLEQLEPAQSFDLVTAADVLPYIGDVEPLLAALARHTRPGSVLALSTEALVGAQEPYALGAFKRFAHNPAALSAALERAGWQVESQEPVIVRLEQEEPVAGELIIARRTAS